jgi:hypothetical protein
VGKFDALLRSTAKVIQNRTLADIAIESLHRNSLIEDVLMDRASVLVNSSIKDLIVKTHPEVLLQHSELVSRASDDIDMVQFMSSFLPGKVLFQIRDQGVIRFCVKDSSGLVHSFDLDPELDHLPAGLGFLKVGDRSQATLLISPAPVGTVFLWKSASSKGSFGMLYKNYGGSFSGNIMLQPNSPKDSESL